MGYNSDEIELVEDGEELVLEEEALDPRRKEKAAKKAARKEKKPPGRFRRKIREVFSELRKVSWPSFKEVVQKTGVVLVVVAVFMVVIYGVDSLLTLGMNALNP